MVPKIIFFLLLFLPVSLNTKTIAYINHFVSLIFLPTNKDNNTISIHLRKIRNSEASTLIMATFSYFQNYPHSLLDPLLFPTPNCSIMLPSFIDQYPFNSLPNTSTIEETSLNPFLDVDQTKSSGFKKQNITTTTATTGSSSCDQLSHVPSTTTVKNRRRKDRNVSNSKVS